MRIAVHDYAGHPFQVQLSRELASRNHEVLHLWSANLPTTPQASLRRAETDPSGFLTEPIDIGYTIDKSNYRRVFLRDDPAHGARAVTAIAAFGPDVILSANSPLRVNKALQDYARRHEAKFAFWVQDLFGEAAKRLLGGGAGEGLRLFEHWLLKRSDAIILITEAFRAYIPVATCPVTVIENWAPLPDLPMRPKVNEWSVSSRIESTLNLLYSGTLGMKHNPELLLRAAVSFKEDDRIRVVVISAGAGIDYLKTKKDELGLKNLLLLPFQPFDRLPDVLGSADILTAILEPDAGVFSVPSKVLTHFCAGRAQLVAIPSENMAAKIVDGAGAGILVSPTDEAGFVRAADRLLTDAPLREKMAACSRRYAENTFNIKSIGDRFEEVFAACLRR